MTPATRIQIYGPYHGPDSPPETTPTRHHRSTPRRIHFPATQVLTSAMLTESSPIRRPPPDIPRLDLACPASMYSFSPLLPSVRRGGPSPPRASVIDGQDLATVGHHSMRAPEPILFSAIVVLPGARFSHDLFPSPVSLSARRVRTYSALVSCDSFLCSWTCTR